MPLSIFFSHRTGKRFINRDGARANLYVRPSIGRR